MLLFRADTGSRSPNRKSDQVEYKTPTSLQANLKAIFARFDYGNKGTIVAEDLFPILDLFEREQGISLLDSEPKNLLNIFCQKNSDLELSAEDLHRLISQLSSPLNIHSPVKSPRNSTPRSQSALGSTQPLSPLSSRRRTTPIISKALSTKKVAVGSLRRRSLPQNGVPTRLCFGEDVKESSPNSSNRSRSIIEEIGSDSIMLGYNALSDDPINEFCSPHQIDIIDNIKTPKSTRHCDTNELWREYSYEASSWISSASEAECSFERLGEAQLKPDKQEDSPLQLIRLNKVTASLNKRLCQAEKSLNSSVHQHEERITDLQNRIDEMRSQLVSKKKDILELKNHEKTHLAQINMLESEVVSVSRLLAHHQTLYADLKRQFEEKKIENEALQQQLKTKDDKLNNAEIELRAFAFNQTKFREERTTLEKHIARLEHEVVFTQTLETEVNELQQENQHLRNVVECLRNDLNDAVKGVHNTSAREFEMHSYYQSQNLHSELAPQLHAKSERSVDSQVVPSFVQVESVATDGQSEYANNLLNEKIYFKAQTDAATQKWLDALEQLEQAKASVKEERESLLAEIERLRNSKVSVSHKDTQCDLLVTNISLVDASTQFGFDEADDIASSISALTNDPVVKLGVKHRYLKDKLSDGSDLQKTVFKEHSAPNDNQAATYASKDNHYYSTQSNRAYLHNFSTVRRIFMIFVLGVLSAVVISKFFFYASNGVVTKESNLIASSWVPQISDLKGVYHASTSLMKYVTQWPSLFSEDNDMIQIPT